MAKDSVLEGGSQRVQFEEAFIRPPLHKSAEVALFGGAGCAADGPEGSREPAGHSGHHAGGAGA